MSKRTTFIKVSYQKMIPLGGPYASLQVGAEEIIENSDGLDAQDEQAKVLKRLKRFVHKELDKGAKEWEKENRGRD